MSARKVLWSAFEITVPDGAEAQVDAVLTRWTQDLRHRLLPAGIETHDGVCKLLDVTLDDLTVALARAARNEG